MAEEERPSGGYSHFNTFHSAVLIRIKVLTRRARRRRIIRFGFQIYPEPAMHKTN